MEDNGSIETVEVALREVITQTDRGQTCVMLLEEISPPAPGRPRRILPIFIGPVEAIALGRAALGDHSPRPQTHDLIVNVAEALGGTLQRVLVTRLERQGDSATFIGALEYLTAAGDIVRADARPSDALVVATRCGVPIHVACAVMDAAATPIDSPSNSEEENPDSGNSMPDDTDRDG
jgi:bifunctional DNase/RNase